MSDLVTRLEQAGMQAPAHLSAIIREAARRIRHLEDAMQAIADGQGDPAKLPLQAQKALGYVG